MKTSVLIPAFICGLVMSAAGQVTNDPQSPEIRKPVDAERAKDGKLATRDQNGTFKTQDGIVRSQGAVQFIKSGEMTRINQETKLSEGFAVRPNGQITKPDGSTITLEEGQMLTLDGRRVQAPRSTGMTEIRNPGQEQPARTGNLTDDGQDGPGTPDGGPVKK